MTSLPEVCAEPQRQSPYPVECFDMLVDEPVHSQGHDKTHDYVDGVVDASWDEFENNEDQSNNIIDAKVFITDLVEVQCPKDHVTCVATVKIVTRFSIGHQNAG